MNPSLDKDLIDVACGTGDIGKLYLDSTNKNSKITCVDPNKGMISQGKQKLSSYKNINWVISPAEKLPFEDNKFDFLYYQFWTKKYKKFE
jgi:demethylmenaquinone methyltransferase/2-methoxy-6-polyprenyl-1,4-benzoquinol methylase